MEVRDHLFEQTFSISETLDHKLPLSCPFFFLFSPLFLTTRNNFQA